MAEGWGGSGSGTCCCHRGGSDVAAQKQVSLQRLLASRPPQSWGRSCCSPPAARPQPAYPPLLSPLLMMPRVGWKRMPMSREALSGGGGGQHDVSVLSLHSIARPIRLMARGISRVWVRGRRAAVPTKLLACCATASDRHPGDPAARVLAMLAPAPRQQRAARSGGRLGCRARGCPARSHRPCTRC
jgi:hypothetical protein